MAERLGLGVDGPGGPVFQFFQFFQFLGFEGGGGKGKKKREGGEEGACVVRAGCFLSFFRFFPPKRSAQNRTTHVNSPMYANSGQGRPENSDHSW